MDNFFSKLELDIWYKSLVYIGGIIFILSVSIDTRLISNAQAGYLGAGLFFIGIGEWKNHKVMIQHNPSNAYTGHAHILQIPIRHSDLVGNFFLIVGSIFLLVFIKFLLFN